jgi:hypothetical protein
MERKLAVSLTDWPQPASQPDTRTLRYTPSASEANAQRSVYSNEPSNRRLLKMALGGGHAGDGERVTVATIAFEASALERVSQKKNE